MRSISANELPPGQYSVVQVDIRSWTTAEKQRLIDGARVRCGGLQLTMDDVVDSEFPWSFGMACADEITSIASTIQVQKDTGNPNLVQEEMRSGIGDAFTQPGVHMRPHIAVMDGAGDPERQRLVDQARCQGCQGWVMKKNQKRCLACSQAGVIVTYCSRACQVAHWENGHKKVCHKPPKYVRECVGLIKHRVVCVCACVLRSAAL